MMLNKTSDISTFRQKTAIMALLVIGWFFILYEYAVRVSDSVIIQPLMQTFNISPTQIGVISSAYNFMYILMQIPAGILIDKFGILKTWLFALLILASGCYIFSISNTLAFALIGRGLMGMGSAFAWVGIISIVTRFFSAKYHAFFIGVSMTLCMLGAVLGQGPWLVWTQQLGHWQPPYFYVGWLGLILAGAVFLFYSRRLVRVTKNTETLTSILSALKPIIKTKQFWFLAVYITTISLPQNAFSALWAVEFFKQHYQFNAETAATIVSAIWFGGILGAPAIGYIASRVTHEKKLLVIFNIVTILLTLVLMLGKLNSAGFAMSVLFLLGFVTNASVIVYAKAAQLGGEKASSTVVSAINMLNMGGAALVQILMGYILTITNSAGHLTTFVYAMSVMPITLLLTLFLFKNNK